MIYGTVIIKKNANKLKWAFYFPIYYILSTDLLKLKTKSNIILFKNLYIYKNNRSLLAYYKLTFFKTMFKFVYKRKYTVL